MCLASPSEYSLVHLDSGAQTSLGLPISQSTEVSSARIRPSIVPVAFDEHGEKTCTFLITSHSDAGTLGAFLRADGEPTDKLLEWPSHPRSVVAEPPYVCALLRNDTIEVHDLRTMRRVQQIPVDASDDPRFLLRIVGSKELLTSGAAVDEHVVPVDHDEVGAEKAGPTLDEPGAAPLPIPPFALEPHWQTVCVLLGFKRSLSCLALPTPASTAWKCAEAQNWSEADHAFQDTELDEQAKIAAVFLGINHVYNARFSNATACFLRGGFDGRLLLAKYPPLRQFHTASGSLYATLKDAWNQLPVSISDLVEANLAANYAPDMDAEALRPLKAQLERRADAMLAELLEAHVQGGGEGQSDAHSALLALALGRDATVPTSAVDAHLDACHVDKVAALLAYHHRYGMQASLLHKHGRTTEALNIWTSMLDKAVKDPVDTVTLHDVAPHIQQLTEQEDLVQYGLWLAKHDTQLGLDALRRVEYSGTDSEGVLASLRALDTHAAEALLEHIVFTSAEQTENLHAELCARLVEILVEAVDKQVYPSDATAEVYSQSATEPFYNYLAKRASLGVVRTRIKLMVLLEHSSVLDRAQTLELLTPHAFLAFEQAIVLGKLGRVSDALRVLALDVRDALSAEAVCLQDGRVLSPAATRAIASDASVGEYVSLIGKESLFVSKPATSARLLRMLLYLYLEQSNLYVPRLTQRPLPRRYSAPPHFAHALLFAPRYPPSAAKALERRVPRAVPRPHAPLAAAQAPSCRGRQRHGHGSYPVGERAPLADCAVRLFSHAENSAASSKRATTIPPSRRSRPSRPLRRGSPRRRRRSPPHST